MAVKYSLIEHDEKLDMVEAIQQSIKNVVQVNTPKKLPKSKSRKRLVKSAEELLNPEKASQLPNINHVRSSLMATGTTILEKV